MEITLDKHTANQASVKIKLNEADYQQKVESKLKDYAKKAVIKGFRPGKAPVSMVKSMYGVSILVDEINNLLHNTLNSYLKEQPFKTIGDPLPVESSDSEFNWKTQKEFEFEYKIGFIEPFHIELDKSIQGIKYSIKVDEKLVDETIENLKNQYGDHSNPEVVELGDSIYGDLTSSNFQRSLSLDTSQLPETLSSKFVGSNLESEITFEANELTTEEWLNAFGLNQEELNDVVGSFTFTVKNINRTTAAELNQEFFDKIFGSEQVNSVEEFANKVREMLQDSYDKESKTFSEEKIKHLILERFPISLPELFLKEWLIRMNGEKDQELEINYPLYAKHYTWSLITNQIAKDHSIKAEHEDVIEKTKEMIRSQFASSGIGAQLEASMDMFVDNYLRGKEGQNYTNMLASVLEEKVLEFVMENINLEEKVISIDEFKELLSE